MTPILFHVEGVGIGKTKRLLYTIREADTLRTLADMLCVNTSRGDAMYYGPEGSYPPKRDLGRTPSQWVHFCEKGMDGAATDPQTRLWVEALTKEEWQVEDEN